MVDNSNRKKAEVINPGLGDIEKVRDILFGKYVAGFEQRFAELESRLGKDIERIQDRLVKQLDDVNEEVSKSLNKLETRLAEENANREGGFDELHSNLAKAESAMKHSINMMEDQANQELSEVRKVLESNQQELVDQLSLAQKELNKEIKSQKKKLEADKVGRQSLALLLDEVAVKLRSEN